jgi:hypothetical protein
MSTSRLVQLPSSQKTRTVITIEIPKHHLAETRDDSSDDDRGNDDSDYEFEARAEFRPSKSASKTNNNNDNEQEEPALAGSSNRKGKQAMKATL